MPPALTGATAFYEKIILFLILLGIIIDRDVEGGSNVSLFLNSAADNAQNQYQGQIDLTLRYSPEYEDSSSNSFVVCYSTTKANGDELLRHICKKVHVQKDWEKVSFCVN